MRVMARAMGGKVSNTNIEPSQLARRDEILGGSGFPHSQRQLQCDPQPALNAGSPEKAQLLCKQLMKIALPER